MLNDEIYAIILEEYKESGHELYDEMFLTQFNYIGGYQLIDYWWTVHKVSTKPPQRGFFVPYYKHGKQTPYGSRLSPHRRGRRGNSTNDLHAGRSRYSSRNRSDWLWFSLSKGFQLTLAIQPASFSRFDPYGCHYVTSIDMARAIAKKCDGSQVVYRMTAGDPIKLFYIDNWQTGPFYNSL